jgi:threonyl-tRNA synthetase
MLVCLRRGLSLVRQRTTPRFLPSPPLRPAASLFIHHLPSADGMGEGSAPGKDAKGKGKGKDKGKGKAPAGASDLVVTRDDSYLEAVTQARIRKFEEIQARQALERLNIGGEVIK